MITRFDNYRSLLLRGRLPLATAVLLTLVLILTTIGLAPASAAATPVDGDAAPAALPEGLTAGDWAQIQDQIAVTTQAAASPLQETYLKASNVEAGDQFGYSVDLDGDTLVVGAPYEDSNGSSPANNDASSAGAVYVFVRTGAGWLQQAYLKAQAATAGAQFGNSVAVDGDTLVVSSIFPGLTADVFTRNGSVWAHQATLTADNLCSHGGPATPVDISGDTVVIGYPVSTVGNYPSPACRGSVHVFVRSGSTWSEQERIEDPAPFIRTYGGQEHFGFSVALDGDTVVIGNDSRHHGWVHNDQENSNTPLRGAAYVYTRSGTSWSQQAELTPPTTGCFQYPPNNCQWFGNGFGADVAVDGDTVAVNAPDNYTDIIGGGAAIYVRAGSTWGEQQRFANPDPSSGAKASGVSISGGQLAIAMGHRYYRSSQAPFVNVYARTAGSWQQIEHLAPPALELRDRTAYSLASSGDTIVAGFPRESSNGTDPTDNSEPYAGAAYVFEPPPAPTEVATESTYLKASNPAAGESFGYDVAVDGDTVIAGAPNGSPAGVAHVFVRDGTLWKKQALLEASYPGGGDLFGSTVAIDDDTVVIGARGEDSDGLSEADDSIADSGAAFVFVRSGTTWDQQAYLKASNLEEGDSFGFSVDIDGDSIVVGALGESSDGSSQDNNGAPNAGAAYVFHRSGTTWTQQAYLKAANADADDWFGWTAAIDADTIVVGAPHENVGGTGPDGGAAYIFVRSGTSWTQQALLRSPSVEAGDLFANAVDIASDLVVVGVPGEDSDGSSEANNSLVNSGAAFVFSRSGTVWSKQGYLMASNADAVDYFGASVAIDSRKIVVGAPLEQGDGSSASDNSAQSSGAAYVFAQDDTDWSQIDYLKASNAELGDVFGGYVVGTGGVAISGDKIVIGAGGEDSDGSSLSDNSVQQAGAAYVYSDSASRDSFATVTSEDDLRTAIETANNGGSGMHWIELTDDVTLNDDLPPLTNTDGETIINGNGYAIDGDDQYALIEVTDDVDATIRSLNLTNGRNDAGGAITNNGTLDLIDSSATSSTAEEGGGIWNGESGTLAVSGSTVSANVAASSHGGGVANYGAMTWVNSTISGNSALLAGGGIANLNTGQATLHSVTISDNEAGRIGGGGLAALDDSSSTLFQLLIAGNRYTGAANGQEVYRATTATVAVNSYNLFGHSAQTTAQALSGLAPGGNDRTATSDGGHPADLSAVLEAALADNGGPTHTHALVSGSPAIDLVPNAVCTMAPVYGVDQRRFGRNIDGDGSPGTVDCDSGAVEFHPASGVMVTVGTEAELIRAILTVNSTGEGGHVINLTADIALTGDLPPFSNIQGAITINGNGHTIDGAGFLQLIEVLAGVTLTIHDLVLTNGSNDLGGGIANFGTVNLYNSTVSGCAALEGGGIWNGGDAALFVTGSAIIGNSAIASYGGGIANYGIAVLVNTTISGNAASEGGGGFANLAEGEATLHNMTLSDNEAGLIGGGGYAALDESTSSFHQTLLSGNRYTGGAIGQEVYRAVTATVSANSHNLFGHGGITTAQALAGVTPGGSDRTATSNGTHPTILDTILETVLAFNGGATQNHALVDDSPALDMAPNAACTGPPVGGVDQRGEPRNLDGDGNPGSSDCDSGAYEYQPVGGLVITAGSEVELLAAIAAVNWSGLGTHALELTGDILLTGDLPPFTNTEGEVVIEGNGHTIDGADLYSLIQVEEGVTLTIQDLTLTNGLNDYGGAIANQGNVTLSNSTISSSTALEGGAIWNAEGAELSIDGSTIAGNEASEGRGGGIANFGEATLVNTTLSGNTAFLAGGGFANMGAGQATMYNVTFSDNEAGQIGGGGYAALDNSVSAFHHNLLSGNRHTGGQTGQEVYRATTATLAVNDYNLFGHAGQTTSQALAGTVVGGNDRSATSDGTHPRALASILETRLASNGGATQTHALVAGSPAIDVVPDDACFAVPVNGVDQRGETRGANGYGGTSERDSDAGAYEFHGPSTGATACPIGANVGYEVTTIVGAGMGSPKHMRKAVKLVVPNPDGLTAVYGQMAAKNFGEVRFVRFIFQGRKNWVEVKPATSLGASGAVSWWGADLDPTEFMNKNWVKGRWFIHAKYNKAKMPRAFVLYPTHDTGDAQYANVFKTFGWPDNFVAGTLGTAQLRTNILQIPETQAVSDISVSIAIADINADPRSIELTVEAGGVAVLQTITGPDGKKMELLNIVEVILENVPAGTDQVSITMRSKPNDGDSAALLGATANYACEP